MYIGIIAPTLERKHSPTKQRFELYHHVDTLIVPRNLKDSTVFTGESYMMRGMVGAGLLLKSDTISTVLQAFSSRWFWLHQKARLSTSFLEAASSPVEISAMRGVSYA